MKNKKSLIRIVRTPAGEVAIDEIGKASGRGAYLCKKTACVAAAKKRRVIERNLKIAECEKLFPLILAMCEDYEK
jgi:predicted RNA-binding protein YlxR (DUF448 family)